MYVNHVQVMYIKPSRLAQVQEKARVLIGRPHERRLAVCVYIYIYTHTYIDYYVSILV